MQQLELALTSREEQLAIHMTLFSIDFTYDELQEWHRIYTFLKYVREGNFLERDV
tara:strand:- start:166 stop:330 length:165 start_codon:yes stop_codon:yes gene_type:complete